MHSSPPPLHHHHNHQTTTLATVKRDLCIFAVLVFMSIVAIIIMVEFDSIIRENFFHDLNDNRHPASLERKHGSDGTSHMDSVIASLQRRRRDDPQSQHNSKLDPPRHPHHEKYHLNPNFGNTHEDMVRLHLLHLDLFERKKAEDALKKMSEVKNNKKNNSKNKDNSLSSSSSIPHADDGAQRKDGDEDENEDDFFVEFHPTHPPFRTDWVKKDTTVSENAASRRYDNWDRSHPVPKLDRCVKIRSFYDKLRIDSKIEDIQERIKRREVLRKLRVEGSDPEQKDEAWKFKNDQAKAEEEGDEDLTLPSSTTTSTAPTKIDVVDENSDAEASNKTTTNAANEEPTSTTEPGEGSGGSNSNSSSSKQHHDSHNHQDEQSKEKQEEADEKADDANAGHNKRKRNSDDDDDNGGGDHHNNNHNNHNNNNNNRKNDHDNGNRGKNTPKPTHTPEPDDPNDLVLHPHYINNTVLQPVFFSNPRPRIAVLTMHSVQVTSDNSSTRRQVQRASLLPLMWYCQKNRYDLIVEDHDIVDARRAPAWSKIRALRKWVPHYEWVIWVDMDVIITNHDRTFEAFIKHRENIILQENEKKIKAEHEHWQRLKKAGGKAAQGIGDVFTPPESRPLPHIIIGNDWNGINSGITMWRNSTFTLGFIKRMWGVPRELAQPFWDQGAMKYLLYRGIRGRDEKAADFDFSHLDITDEVNRYPIGLLMWGKNTEQINWKEGNWLVHFASCKYFKTCIKWMNWFSRYVACAWGAPLWGENVTMAKPFYRTDIAEATPPPLNEPLEPYPTQLRQFAYHTPHRMLFRVQDAEEEAKRRKQEEDEVMRKWDKERRDHYTHRPKPPAGKDHKKDVTKVQRREDDEKEKNKKAIQVNVGG